MNKKVMDALEAVADEAERTKRKGYSHVTVDAENLNTLLSWALGQRIHLQFGEEVGLTVYEDEEEGEQPDKGKIVGFSGMDGVLVEVEDFDAPLYYDRKDVHTL